MHEISKGHFRALLRIDYMYIVRHISYHCNAHMVRIQRLGSEKTQEIHATAMIISFQIFTADLRRQLANDHCSFFLW